MKTATQWTLESSNIDVQADGTVRRYTMVGSYPLFYLDSRDNCLCASCADETIADHDSPEGGIDVRDLPVGAHVNWESLLYCDQCSTQIEAAYEVVE